MLRLEGFVEIQVLQRQGKSIRAISAELGIARNTVRKYLRGGGTPKMKQRPARPSKLDPFREYLEERIRAALPDRIPSSVLGREIAERGYQGKGSILRAYVARLRPAPATGSMPAPHCSSSSTVPARSARPACGD